MSDATIDATLLAIGVILTGLAGGFVFVGVFRDATSLQKKLMKKKHLDAASAADKVVDRRRAFGAAFVAFWIASLLVDIAALVATVGS